MANTFGYGAMTNSINDIINSKAVLIIGSNPAENHPVGMQHILRAKEHHGAKIIVVDPRYTKTAAKADYYVRVRPGTDIPFMYGMINLIIQNGWDDKDFYLNRVYGMEKAIEESKKYTPEVVQDITGVPAALLREVTEVFAKNKPGTLLWAMGLTQHTIGASNTRLAPTIQMILGNMGKAGGGCNILRGHDNVQGATDMGCNSDTLPGYYGLAEGAWKHFSAGWGVDYEWMKGRFKSKDLMEKVGFTLARWNQGVLEEEKIYNGGTNLKALVVLGNGITSTALQPKVKAALDKLELIVLADPFVNEAAVLTDKKDNVFLLPAATQMETSGSVVATNRSIQWRHQVVKPVHEAKPDQEIMFELAKRLGFYKEYTKSLGDGNGNFSWPEDATREINKNILTIGMQGATPERLKKHSDNWHLFSVKDLMGKDTCANEYFGVPWPCWSENHPGSPNLYDTSKSVMEGGLGFRNGWTDKNAEGKVVTVYEKDGVNLMAGDGFAPVGSKVAGGYGEITPEELEKLGIALSPEEAEKVKGKNWKTDRSGILVKKALENGLAPFGNGRARAFAWNLGDKLPIHREPIHSQRADLAKKYPAQADKKDFFRVDTQYITKQKEKDWSKEFPINLVTGRLVVYNGAGVETRASKYLAELVPEMFVRIHPNLAKELGVKNNSMVWVHSPEGSKIKVKAKYSHQVDEKSVFMPFHFAGVFQGEDLSHKYPQGCKPYATGESVNTITNYGFDSVTQMPETKGGLCRIEKA